MNDTNATLRAIQMAITGTLLVGWTLIEPGSQLLVSLVGGWLLGGGLTALYMDARAPRRLR